MFPRRFYPELPCECGSFYGIAGLSCHVFSLLIGYIPVRFTQDSTQ